MNSKPKILYLSYDGLTDPLGRSQILPYLLGLSSAFDFTIVSFEKKELYNSQKEEVSGLLGDRINWIPKSYTKKPLLFSTLFDLLVLKNTCSTLVKEKDFTIVHCRSYITSLIGVWLKGKYKLKFIFDMRGFWADERIEGGLWNLRNPLFLVVYNYFKRKEREFARHADHIVVLTEAAKRIIQKWNVNQAITVIPCCVDLALFNPETVQADTQNLLRKQLGFCKTDLILLYLGSLGTWYLFDEMLSFYKRTKQQDPSAKFLILTPDLQKVPQGPGIIGMTVPRSQVPLYISISDACLCFIKPSYSKQGSSATKMAEVLAMQVPVITNPGWGDIEFLQRKLTGLYVIRPEHRNLSIRELLHSDKRKQTTEFGAFFSLESGVKRYEQVYRSVN